MAVARRAVLERLAAESSAARGETTTVDRLAASLDVEAAAVESHLTGLAACELARVRADGAARITVTGEELLDLDTDELAIVDPGASSPET